MPRTRWLRSAACALGLTLASSQEPAPAKAASPADQGRAEIDRLIAQLDGLGSFRAEYEFKSPKGDETIVFEYGAPGSARLQRLRGDKEVMQVVIAGGVLALRRDPSAGGAGAPAWRVDLGPIYTRWFGAVEDQLEQHAPKLAAEYRSRAAAHGYGPCFDVGIAPRSESPRPGEGIRVGLTYVQSSCSRFHWLCKMRLQSGQLALRDGALSLELDDRAITVSKVTGFVEECTSGTGADRRQLKLVRLSRDEKLPGGGIAVPPGVPDAPDAMRNGFHGTAIGMASSSVVAVLGRAADAGELEWNDDTRAGLDSALRGFFGGAIDFLGGEFVDGESKRIDERAETLRSHARKEREKGRDADELRTEIQRSVDEARAKLERGLEQSRDDCLALIFSDPRPPAAGREAAGREIERAAALKAWEDAARLPVLAHFESAYAELRKD